MCQYSNRCRQVNRLLNRVLAIVLLASPPTATYAQTKWTPDRRVAQPSATNYCLNGVCLGMPLNQLPTVLPAFSPDQGYWADVGDPSQTINEVARMVDMKNPCGGDLRAADLSYEKTLTYWTGHDRSRLPLFQRLLTDGETLQRHRMEVIVSAVPKIAPSQDSIYLVTHIKTKLTFSPD